MRALTLAVTGACGDSGGGFAVEVRVYSAQDETAGEPEVSVVASDADGALLERTATDSGGRAVVHAAAGGSVSISRGDGATRQVATVLAVEAGDELSFGARPSPPFNRIGTMTVEVTPYPGAIAHYVGNGCFAVVVNGAETRGELGFIDACGAGPYDILAFAVVRLDGGENEIGAIQRVDDVELVDGGTIAVAGDWTEPPIFTSTVTDFPDEATGAVLVYEEIHDGNLYSVNNWVLGEPAGTWVKPMAAAGFGDRMQLTVRLQAADAPESYLRDTAPIADAYEVAVATAMLPWVSAAIYDPGTGVASWSTSGPTAAADGGYFALQHADGASWLVVLPPGPTAVTLPELPDDLALPAIAPAQTAAGLYASSAVDGYAAFRGDAAREYQNRMIYGRGPGDRHLHSGGALGIGP